MNMYNKIFLLLLLWFNSSFASQQQNHFGQKVQQQQIHQPAMVQKGILENEENLITQPSHITTPVQTQNFSEEREECRSGFSVRKSLRSTLKSKTQIKFQEVLTNAGGWDSTTHMFVANCPGIYFFTFNGLSEEGLGFTIALMKNDKFQVTAYGGKAGYQWGSNSALLFLNKGDQVYLQLQDGEIYEHPFNEAYTTFTGFLVNKF